MVVTTSTAGFTIPPNTEIVSITNNVATLSNNITGSGQITLTAIGPSDTTAVDGGMIVKGTTDKKITWKGTDGGVTYNTWVSSENFDLASGKILTLDGVNIADPTNRTIGPRNGGGAQEIDLSGGGLAYTLGSAVTGSSLTSVGNLTALGMAGNILPTTDGTRDLGSSSARWSNVYAQNYRFNANGNITYNTVANTMEFEVNGGQVAEFSSGGAFVPNADNTRNLGAPARRWANIYSADLQLSNEGAANEVDGTWGQYTIQEGEDDLFLINRRSGKKYKFMLQEVQ